MKFSQVTEDGTYVKPQHEKLSYGTMIFVRANMIKGARAALTRAVTIATRYSCVRKQGMLLDNKSEMKIMDYKTQQIRLIPLITTCFAFQFAANYIEKLYQER